MRDIDTSASVSGVLVARTIIAQGELSSTTAYTMAVFYSLAGVVEGTYIGAEAVRVASWRAIFVGTIRKHLGVALRGRLLWREDSSGYFRIGELEETAIRGTAAAFDGARAALSRGCTVLERVDENLLPSLSAVTVLRDAKDRMGRLGRTVESSRSRWRSRTRPSFAGG